MNTIIVNTKTNINTSNLLGSSTDKKKSCEKYTLNDVSDSVNRLHSISMFLNSGAYTDDIRANITEHLLNEIESLQGVLTYAQVFSLASGDRDS
ncbi:hypothetical protein [Vibrio sp.]|jgi:6-phosphogluconate dehydrogenase|uniref:hypothetical protein n=1 Tax=Vibrio sp. TaxID=678 RepID=UPI003F6CEAB2